MSVWLQLVVLALGFVAGAWGIWLWCCYMLPYPVLDLPACGWCGSRGIPVSVAIAVLAWLILAACLSMVAWTFKSRQESTCMFCGNPHRPRAGMCPKEGT